MISIETTNPVYSQFGGKNLTEAEKTDRQKARLERALRFYQAAKETGSLTALENIAMRRSGQQEPLSTLNDGNMSNQADNSSKGWRNLSSTMKVTIVGGGILITGLALFFALRKSK